jgi:CHAP domain
VARCDSYVAGQCTRGACDLASWVPDGWQDAGHWPTAAVAAGFTITKVPTLGAIVVYAGGTTAYSNLGHVALVTSLRQQPDIFDVKEMDYVAAFTYDERSSTMFDVDFFILPPGVAAGAGSGTLNDTPVGLPGLLTVWTAFQDLWNNVFDQHVAAINQVIGLTDPLSHK